MACWVPDSRSEGVHARVGNLALRSASNLSRDCSVVGDVRTPVLMPGGRVVEPRLPRCVIAGSGVVRSAIVCGRERPMERIRAWHDADMDVAKPYDQSATDDKAAIE